MSVTILGIVVETTAKTISEARYLAVAQAVRRTGWRDGVIVVDVKSSGKRRWRFVVAPREVA